MDLIPYEILQHIASSLLPRYQCRLALVSKHHYRYLYTDLLRWHARKAPLKAPKYRLYKPDKSSISEHNNKVIYYRHRWDTTYVYNLTKCYIVHIGKYEPEENISVVISKENRIYVINDVAMHGIDIFNGFYKYMDRDLLIMCASIRMSPLLSLPRHILAKILRMVNRRRARMYKIHEYFRYIQF